MGWQFASCLSVDRFLSSNGTTVLDSLFAGRAWRGDSVGYKRLPIESGGGLFTLRVKPAFCSGCLQQDRRGPHFSLASRQKIDMGWKDKRERIEKRIVTLENCYTHTPHVTFTHTHITHTPHVTHTHTHTCHTHTQTHHTSHTHTHTHARTHTHTHHTSHIHAHTHTYLRSPSSTKKANNVLVLNFKHF